MDQLPDLTAATLPWWHYVIAVVAVIAGFVAAGFARRGVRRVLSRARGIPDTFADVSSRFLGYLIVLLGFAIGLTAIGIDLQLLMVILLIVLAIAAFVLKGVADNFAAGVLLQTTHPLAPGDEVTVEIPDGSATGTVVELGPRAVVVRSYDGRVLHVPNGQLVSDTIVVTPAGGMRRSDAHVRVERDGRDVDAILTRIAELTASAAGVTSVGASQADPLEISPARIIARVRFWHGGQDATPVAAAVVRSLAAGLAEDGLTATVTTLTPPPPATPPGTL